MGGLQGVRIAFLAINGALVRDDKHRSSWRRPPTTAKTAENPIMESACNYEASVSYVLPRASQHARYSNGVRERTRASALIYFASREEGVCYPFLSSSFFHHLFTTPSSLLRYVFIRNGCRVDIAPPSCIISAKFRRRSI